MQTVLEDTEIHRNNLPSSIGKKILYENSHNPYYVDFHIFIPLPSQDSFKKCSVAYSILRGASEQRAGPGEMEMLQSVFTRGKESLKCPDFT